jgi:hypothetical protein
MMLPCKFYIDGRCKKRVCYLIDDNRCCMDCYRLKFCIMMSKACFVVELVESKVVREQWIERLSKVIEGMR